MKSNVNQGCTAKTLHNTLSDCAYLFKNVRFLRVTVSEIVKQLKKYIQSLIMSLHLVLSIIMSTLRNPSPYSISLARTERFKRSFVLYALRSFPTDISEDFCDDFITYVYSSQGQTI